MLKKFIEKYPFLIIATSLGFLIFTSIITFHIGTDIQVHLFIIMDNVLPVHFIYFGLADLLSGFTKNIYLLSLAAIFLLTLAIGAKYFMSKKIIFEDIIEKKTPKYENLAKLIIFLILILHPIIYYFDFSKSFMHGKIPVNTWHNSTTIFIMPFVLLLFWHSFKYLKTPKKQHLLYILLFSGLCTFIKPNIMGVFLPVFSVFLLIKYRLKKDFWKGIGIVIISGLILSSYFYFSYFVQNSTDEIVYKGQKSGIEIAPFKHFITYCKTITGTFISSGLLSALNITLDFITSSLFPIIFSIFYFKKSKNKLIFQYSWAYYIVTTKSM